VIVGYDDPCDRPYGPTNPDYEGDAVNEIPREDLPMVVLDPAAATPTSMLLLAVQRGASIEQMQQLMDLQERHERNEARKAYFAAITEFKKNAPVVLKDKANTQYKSRYSSIGEWVEKITPALSAHGLTARWELDQTGPAIKITCVLTHALGHSESSTMSGPPDKSGAKNPLQEIKSTVTYLEIATLQAITGLASKEGALDDDGSLGKTMQMDENVKLGYLAKIAALADLKSADVLWATIADECTKAGDVPAYDELKAAMAAQRKALKKAEPATI